jgi:predicted metalloendopeptidase
VNGAQCRRLAQVALAALLTGSCVAVREPDRDETAALAATRLTPDQVASTVRAAMDPTADPCRDFYQYACGGWMQATRPPAAARFVRGSDAVEERNRFVLRDILEAAARARGGPPEVTRLGTYYAACMDEEVIDRVGVGPLQEVLSGIAGVSDATSLMRTLGWLHARGIPIVFTPEARTDAAAAASAPRGTAPSIACLTQGGLGLADRDIYLRADARGLELRRAYRDHVAKMLELAGEHATDAERLADGVVGLETQIAGFSVPSPAGAEPGPACQRIDRAGLQRLTPDLPWDPYFQTLGYPALDALGVGAPAFLAGLNDLVPKADPETVRAYLKWQVVHLMADALPRSFGRENFAFYGTILEGRPEIDPRWKRCVAAADRDVGESLAREFMNRRIGDGGRAIATGTIEDVERALGSMVEGLTFVDGTARRGAEERLREIANEVGASERDSVEAGPVFRRTSHFTNVAAAARFAMRRQLSAVGGAMTLRGAGTTGAVTARFRYDPLLDALVVPVGALQPPLFSPDFPRPLNLGALGAGIGRGLVMGLDETDLRADATERAHCVESLYDTYEVAPGVRVDGARTLRDNLADLGGIEAAHRALRSTGGPAGDAPSPIPGLTNDQLFFVGFAQSLCEAIGPGSRPDQAGADPRVPGRFRVRGTLSSCPAFAEAFYCGPETPMNPKERCEVW